MSENHLKISRRKFLATAGAGALAALFAPGMLAAAGRNVAPVQPGNPLFSGAIGQYEGVNIVHTPGDGMTPYDDRMILSQVRDAAKRGSGWSKIKPVKIDGTDYYVCMAERIPFNDLLRKG